ncbi:MAG: GMC family oxidoreductase [Myxococcota bacterium]|jgi:choline dehydrogenase-like flavoprotein
MPELNVTSGRDIRTNENLEFDAVVVGSGPAGAAVARSLSRSGMKVVVFEDGPLVRPKEFFPDGFRSMAQCYRDMGASVLMGNAPMPFLQGRLVGGGSVINGAISWRLPRDIYDLWVKGDSAIGQAISWDEISAATDAVEGDLNILPTEPAVAGPNNTLMAKGADAMGIEHRRISRNVRGCTGLGMCLQGCPKGFKLSMDMSYLPDATEAGAVIYSDSEVVGVTHDGTRATGVTVRTAGGGTINCMAGRAVVLAASAVQSPIILMKSGIGQGPVGRNFMGHPGTSMSGYFRDPVRVWTGATQGHEVIGLRKEGIKFEALGYDLAVAAARLKGTGRALADSITGIDHWAAWGVALRAQGRGTVKPGGKRASVNCSLTKEDVIKLRRGVAVIGEMMLAAGAEYVTPGVPGWHERVTDRKVMARFETEGPLDPKLYTMVVTHMFGTCTMGSDPKTSVVRTDFRHHAIDRLYVADSSVFPTNTGVNPQTSIIAMASICAKRIAA